MTVENLQTRLKLMMREVGARGLRSAAAGGAGEEDEKPRSQPFVKNEEEM
jgi:hypothetical protein